MIRTAVEAMIFQSINRRLDRRMLTSGISEVIRVFNLTIGSRKSAFAGQNDSFQNFSWFPLIIRTVKTLIKGAAPEFFKSLFRFPNDRHSDQHIGFIFHYPIMKDKSELIFDCTDIHAQFLPQACFAFDYPSGVFLKNRECFLIMGNGHTINHPSANQIDLSLRMGDEPVNHICFQLCDNIKIG